MPLSPSLPLLHALERAQPGRWGIKDTTLPCAAHLPAPGPPSQITYPQTLQDPHFKASKHRRRIIQHTLLAEYAYLPATCRHAHMS